MTSGLSKDFFCLIRHALFLLLCFCILATTLACRPNVKEEVPSGFLKNEADYYLADQLAGHLHRPNAQRAFTWEEHPTGKMVMQTNNLGFREDLDTEATPLPDTVRVLVTGDSHTDGVVYNNESFPNVLESLLAKSSGPSYEIINGGVGRYTFGNYDGFFEKYAYLNPKLFIVTVYTGNDFMETAKLLELARKGPLTRPADYLNRLRDAEGDCSGGTFQALNQIFYFKLFGQMKEPVLGEVCRRILNINLRCKETDARLLVLLMPTMLDVQPGGDGARLKKATASLDLSSEDLKINRNLTLQLASWLGDNGVDHLDLHDFLESQKEPTFWLKDYHLNTLGHRVIAEAIYSERLKLFESLQPKNSLE